MKWHAAIQGNLIMVDYCCGWVKDLDDHWSMMQQDLYKKD